jgi:ribonuclease Z
MEAIRPDPGGSTDLTLAGLDIRAVSVAGMETCIEVPSWRLAMDIGRCPPSSVRMSRVLFTHGHLDHMGAVAAHCGLRSLQGMSPPTYYVPEAYVPGFNKLMAAWRELDRSELPHTLVPVAPGDELPFKRRRVRVFGGYHRAPSVGYALVDSVSKLKDEFLGVPGQQIGEARARGIEVTHQQDAVRLAFCGDTTARVLDEEPWLYKVGVLVLECTFLDGPRERAATSGHVHMQDLVERAALFENDAVLLTHFSRRYSADKIFDVLRRDLPSNLADRAVPLLPGAPW